MTVSELRTLVDNLDEYIHIPGGIDRLKKTVLHLAVSGQLVPQDPSEGTGQELYRRIQAEKAETVKLKKKKAATEISDDEARISIPDTWEWVRVGEIAKINSGTSYSKNDLDPGGIRILRGGNVVDNGSLTIKDDDVFVSSALRDEGKKVFKGDIVIVASTGSMSAIGKPSIADSDIDAYIGAFLRIIRSHHSVDKGYFWIYIQSDLYRGYIRSKVQGTNINNIKNEYITENIFPLPPMAEQKRIVAKLDSIFALIDQLAGAYKYEQAERSKFVASSLAQLAKGEDGVEDSLALTHLPEIIRTKADAKILRQTILHLAVSGQLVPQDPSEGTGEELYRKIQSEKAVLVKQGKIKKQKTPPEINEDKAPFIIPSNWKWVRTGEVVNVNSGTSYSKKDLDPNGIRILRGGNIVDGLPLEAKDDDVFVSSALKDERKKVSIGDVVIVASTGSMTAIGKPSIVDRDMDAYIGAFLRILRAHNMVDRDYFWIYIQSDLYRSYIRSKVQGTNINNIKNEYITENMFPLAPLEEQKRIVAKTTQLLNLVTELEEHLVD